MYGQPRTWERCFPYIQEQFINDSKYEFDFFCEVKSYNIDKFTKIQVDVPLVEVQELLARYNPISSVVAHVDSFNGYGAFSGMFASIARSLMLKQQHEIQTGTTYDLVVLHRYDVIGHYDLNWFKQLVAPRSQSMFVFTSMDAMLFMPEGYKYGINDLVLVGDNIAMNVLLGKLMDVVNPSDLALIEAKSILGPNVILRRAILGSDISLHEMPIEPVIIRPDTLIQEDLEACWELMQKHWVEQEPGIKYLGRG